MALLKCKECGSDVSTQAKACPKCGARPPKKTSIVTWAVLGMVLLAVWLGATDDGPGAQPATSASAISSAAPAKPRELDQRTKEFAWMEVGKDAVRAKLKDPKSAEFKDVYFFRGKDGVPMTCGQVNAKNGFGGYAGFKRFVSAGNAEMTFLEGEVSDFYLVWNKFCAK